MIPKNPKIAKKSSKSQAFSRPGLADCAKRFQLTDKTTLKCDKEFDGKGVGAQREKEKRGGEDG